MNLQELFNRKPRKPFVLGNGKPNKYHQTSLDGHRVLSNGSIVVKTLMVGNKVVDNDYDAKLIKEYEKDLKALRNIKKDLKAYSKKNK